MPDGVRNSCTTGPLARRPLLGARPPPATSPVAAQTGDPLGAERLEAVAEVPCVLRDARAGVAVRRPRAAAVVALDRPDGEEVHAVVLREAEYRPGVVERGDLGLLREVVDAGQQRHSLHLP